jgi:hypothetical protein
LTREGANFFGNYRKSTSFFASAGSFNTGIEGEQVGLGGKATN